MQGSPPLDIGPIYIGAQPRPIDTVHIVRPPRDYSLSPHDRGLSIVRQPYLAQRYDNAKHFNAIIKLDVVTTAEKLKPIIEEEYRATIQTLQQALDHEITNIIKTHHTASTPNSIDSKKHEKYIIDLLTLGKDTERKSATNLANAYFGSDPLAKSMHDLLASIERAPKQRPSHVFQAWSNSYAAAYSAMVLSESVRLLTDKSHQLSSTIAALEAQQIAAQRAEIAAKAAAEQRTAQAQQAAARQAEIAARAAAVQRAAQAQQAAARQAEIAARAAAEQRVAQAQQAAARQADIAARAAAEAAKVERERAEAEIAKKAAEEKKTEEHRMLLEHTIQLKKEQQEKQKDAKHSSDLFFLTFEMLKKKTKNIDNKLLELKETHKTLSFLHKIANKASADTGRTRKDSRVTKREGVLRDVEVKIQEAVQQKRMIDNVRFTTSEGAHAIVRPLLATPDGLIIGYENLPLSLSSAIDLMKKSAKTVGRGPVVALIESILYSPSIGNGELQKSPVVLSIPLSQFVPEHSEVVTKSKFSILPFRVVSTISENHTQLFLSKTGDVLSAVVRNRMASYNPDSKLYTFTTEGLNPRTLTWTPNNAPSGDELGSTELPVSPTEIKIYSGARITSLAGRFDDHPTCDEGVSDDYILTFPAESGIDPIYVMVSQTGPRFEPGKVTGYGQKVGRNWLDNATSSLGAPVPAQIADRLRDQNFRNFGSFREQFWKSVAADAALSQQFGRVDLEQMKYGAAPYSGPLDSVGGREKIEIHHKRRITDGGAVYDLENLSLLTPKAHIELHKKGSNE